MALIVVYTGSRRFTRTSTRCRARNEAVVTSLQSTDKPPDGWNATAIYALSQAAMVNNVNLAVYSTEGKLLFTARAGTSGCGTGAGMGQRPGMMGGATG